MQQAVVHIDAIALTEQLFAPFFDAHLRLDHLAYHEAIDLMNGFVEQTDGLADWLHVHFDEKAAGKLVVVEFDPVLLDLSNFQCKFHTIRLVMTCYDSPN